VLAWGVSNLPEDEIQALGDVSGLRALELGCGACQFGIKVAMRGARVTGLDFSANQLRAAGPNFEETGIRFPLVRASAEELPFADASFDLLFCDHGAMTFADPHVTVPEASRVLRPGGRLVFNMSTPSSGCVGRPRRSHPGASSFGRTTGWDAWCGPRPIPGSSGSSPMEHG
jgi:ubiquinone/menaquinone biosynthesis C-methylase UbiE